jgi:hypothetical protein
MGLDGTKVIKLSSLTLHKKTPMIDLRGKLLGSYVIDYNTLFRSPLKS